MTDFYPAFLSWVGDPGRTDSAGEGGGLAPRAAPDQTALAQQLLGDEVGLRQACAHVEEVAPADPARAFSQATALGAIIQQAGQLVGGTLTPLLNRALDLLRHVVATIAKAAEAASYTLTVGFGVPGPLTVSLGVTFGGPPHR